MILAPLRRQVLQSYSMGVALLEVLISCRLKRLDRSQPLSNILKPCLRYYSSSSALKYQSSAYSLQTYLAISQAAFWLGTDKQQSYRLSFTVGERGVMVTRSIQRKWSPPHIAYVDTTVEMLGQVPIEFSCIQASMVFVRRQRTVEADRNRMLSITKAR